MTTPPPQLASDVIKELGIENLPASLQGELIARLGEQVMKRLAIAAYDRLTADQRIAAERLIEEEEEDPEALSAFYEKAIPDFGDLVAKTTAETVAEFKRFHEEAK